MAAVRILTMRGGKVVVARIDERVQYRGLAWLRELSGQNIKEKVQAPVILQYKDDPVVVMIPYDQYLVMQEALWPASPVAGSFIDFVEESTGEKLGPHERRIVEAMQPQPDLNHPTCQHCGNPSEAALCASCFTSGHRKTPQNCLKCAEVLEAKRRAEQDSTGADRPDIDRMAFND